LCFQLQSSKQQKPSSAHSFAQQIVLAFIISKHSKAGKRHQHQQQQNSGNCSGFVCDFIIVMVEVEALDVGICFCWQAGRQAQICVCVCVESLINVYVCDMRSFKQTESWLVVGRV